MTNPLLNVTDYRKTWVEGYTRQSQQLDRYHKQLTLRDQQEEKAKTAVTPVKMLTQFADTLNKGVTAINKIDEGIGAKVKQKLDKLAVTGTAFDVLRMLEKHDGDEAAIHKEYTNYSELISGLPAGAKDYLKSLHGRNLYWAKAYLTNKKSLELGTQYTNLQNYTGADQTIIAERDKLNLDLNAAQGNDLKRKARLKEWASKQFGDEFISDQILSKFAAENIDKFLNIEGILNAHTTTEVTNVKSENDLIEKINIAKADPTLFQQLTIDELDIAEADVKNANKIYTDSGVIINGVYIDGITEKSSDRAIARRVFANRLIKLSNGDQLLRSDIDNLFEKNVLKGAPQGDSIGNFFTEDELAHIYAAADRATVRAGLRATAAKNKQNENLVNSALGEY